jgi:ABC-type antimicrobial peptide transport system permease subunit
MQSPTLVVRASADPSVVTQAVLSEVKAVDRRLPPPVIRTMDHILADTVAQPRFLTWLLSLFGVSALLLAVIGIYGLISYSVTQRTRELGIRMALGAPKRHVLLLVMRHGLWLALSGVCAGVLAALALTRVLRSLLYETDPTDPATFAGLAVLLTVTALLACWFPARRAANVDPMVALRSE